MRQAVAAEWTKLWSVRSTWWCLAGATALMALAALTLGTARATEHPGQAIPVTEPVVSASTFTQIALVVLGILAITSEYASGSIRGTLQATPIRGGMLAAKALVVAPVLFAASVVAGGIGAVLSYLVLRTEIFGASGTLSWSALSDLLRLGVSSALVSVMALGVGAALRSAAGTLTVVFMLLMGLPLVLVMTGSQALVEVSFRLPMFAGLAFMESTDNLTGGPIPYSSGEGLAWLVFWAALALASGYAVLRRRDA